MSSSGISSSQPLQSGVINLKLAASDRENRNQKMANIAKIIAFVSIFFALLSLVPGVQGKDALLGLSAVGVTSAGILSIIRRLDPGKIHYEDRVEAKKICDDLCEMDLGQLVKKYDIDKLERYGYIESGHAEYLRDLKDKIKMVENGLLRKLSSQPLVLAAATGLAAVQLRVANDIFQKGCLKPFVQNLQLPAIEEPQPPVQQVVFVPFMFQAQPSPDFFVPNQ